MLTENQAYIKKEKQIFPSCLILSAPDNKSDFSQNFRQSKDSPQIITFQFYQFFFGYIS